MVARDDIKLTVTGMKCFIVMISLAPWLPASEPYLSCRGNGSNKIRRPLSKFKSSLFPPHKYSDTFLITGVIPQPLHILF